MKKIDRIVNKHLEKIATSILKQDEINEKLKEIGNKNSTGSLSKNIKDIIK